MDISKEEVKEYMKITYNEKWESAIDNIVQYARHLEKEYHEGSGKKSGTMFIRDFALRSNLSPENYAAMLPAIMFYDKPYVINVNQPTE